MLIHASLPGQNLRKKTKNNSNLLFTTNQLNQSDHVNGGKCISERFISIPRN